MKEFKIDTWWKKLLIYVCMFQAGATLLALIYIMIATILAVFGFF